MRGLSVLQPWASLLALGWKKVETRSWRSLYRGPILIHASKGFPGHCKAFARDEHLAGRLPDPTTLPLASVIAIAEVTDCLPTREAESMVSGLETELGDWSAGRYGIFLENVRALPTPIPWSGCLGLWPVPDSLRAQVEAQLQ